MFNKSYSLLRYIDHLQLLNNLVRQIVTLKNVIVFNEMLERKDSDVAEQYFAMLECRNVCSDEENETTRQT